MLAHTQCFPQNEVRTWKKKKAHLKIKIQKLIKGRERVIENKFLLLTPCCCFSWSQNQLESISSWFVSKIESSILYLLAALNPTTLSVGWCLSPTANVFQACKLLHFCNWGTTVQLALLINKYLWGISQRALELSEISLVALDRFMTGRSI